MISRLNIRNFKSHKNTDLELAPLTILTGMNSCGKSSVIQSLLVLRQTYMKNRISKGLELNEPLTSIGTGQDALYCYAKDDTISFELEFDKKESLLFKYRVEPALLENFIPKDDSIAEFTQGDLAKSLFNNNFQYLSAMRWGGRSSFPQGSYEVKYSHQISRNYGQGELIGNFLDVYKGIDTYNYLDCDGSTMPLLEQVGKWEQLISKGILIEIQKDVNNNGFFLTYGMEGEGDNKTITGQRAENVGFGISYSLPIIVALVSAEPDSLIIIENPEAHLHPEGIAIISHLICSVAQRGIQVVIETHSDHIVNGILVACKQYAQKQKGIDRENVMIHFFDSKKQDGSSINKTITITEELSLSYQPLFFFDRIEKDKNYLFFDE